MEPLDASLISAFDASPGDLRRGVTIDEAIMSSPKFPQTGGPEHDWIEIRLADVILLYAESLNANGKSNEAIAQLNKIRSRAGLSSLDATSLSSSTAINEAIHKERRLELAFEGHKVSKGFSVSRLDLSLIEFRYICKQTNRLLSL